MSLSDDLIAEFRKGPRLKKTDAASAAFTALAYACGWPNAKIGRYTGVSRARIGQKVDKFKAYIAQHDMPILQALLTPIGAGQVHPNAVAFTIEDWDNREFATGMLEFIEGEVRRSRV